MKTVRTRFAPSPTGFMHLGNLRSALYTYLMAKSQGGKFILRIEDTDSARYVEGATQVIYDTLAACGMEHDEGPDVGGDYGPYIQSQRKDLYLPYARRLVEEGKAYYCFCTPERLEQLRAQMGEEYKYDKHCLHTVTLEEADRRIAAGEPYVIRQNVPTTGTTSFTDMVYGTITVENDTLDDMILIKADGMPTYNFANVIDDHLMGITHVMRGSEYLSSTPKYNLLYEAFGWEIPVYVHLPQVMRDATHKLSKRDGDAYFSDYTDKGYLPEAIVNYLALLGWSPGTTQEIFTMEELKQAFDIHNLNKSPAIFDATKLAWMNGEYIKAMDEKTFDGHVRPWFDRSAVAGRYDYTKLGRLLKTRIQHFDEIPEMVAFLPTLPDYDVALYTHKKMKTDPIVALDALKDAREALASLPVWDETAIHDALMALIERKGVKNGQVFWPVRVALTGVLSSPGGAIEIADILGREESLARIDKGIEKLNG
ncbi:MAG: glutamate--tRNA ligase [Eubacteriales bacterium]|nr:glutamate--tRNA ligase [Eubacteriales bacterium]